MGPGKQLIEAGNEAPLLDLTSGPAFVAPHFDQQVRRAAMEDVPPDWDSVRISLEPDSVMRVRPQVRWSGQP